MISALTFLFWIYFFPLIGCALFVRFDKNPFHGQYEEFRFFSFIPFLNLLIFIVLIVFIIFDLVVYAFNLVAGNHE